MANYFEELLDSYNRLKKRQLRINLSKIDEQAIDRAAAEQQLLAALEKAKAGQGTPYMPFNTPNFTFQVTKSGKNPGGVGVYYEGLGSHPRRPVMSPQGQRVCDDTLWEKLIKAFMDGGPEKGSMATSDDIEKQNPGKEAEIDPRTERKNILERIHEEIPALLDKAEGLVEKFKEIPEKFTVGWDFFGGFAGSLARQIIDFDGNEQEVGEIVEALNQQNILLDIAFKRSEGKEFTPEDKAFIENNIRIDRDHKTGKYLVWFRGEVTDDFGKSFAYGRYSPLRYISNELLSDIRKEEKEEKRIRLKEQREANKSGEGGNLSSKMAHASERMMMLTSLFVDGKVDQAKKMAWNVWSKGMSDLKEMFVISDNLVEGTTIATEEDIETKDFLDGLMKFVDEVGGDDDNDKAGQIMKLVTHRVLKATIDFWRVNSKTNGEEGSNGGRDFIIQVGGQTGGGKKGDILEGGWDEDAMRRGLEKYGYSSTKVDKIIEEGRHENLKAFIKARMKNSDEDIEKVYEKYKKEFMEANGLEEIYEDKPLYTHDISAKLYRSTGGDRKLGESNNIHDTVGRLMDEKNEVTKEMMEEFGLNLEGENNSTYKEYSEMLADLKGSLTTIDNFMDSAMTGVETMDDDACIRHMGAVFAGGGVMVGVGGFVYPGIPKGDMKDLTTMINKARDWQKKGKNPGKELDLIKVYLQRKMITQKVLKGMNAEKPNIAKAGRCLLASLTHSMGAPLRSTTIIDGSLQKDSDGKYHRAHAADAKKYTSESLRAFIDTEPTDEDKGYTHKSGSTTIDIHADGKINFERNGTKLRGRVTASRENMKKFANLDYLGGKKVTYTDKTKQRNPSENYLKDFLNNQQNILENLFNYINQ